MNKKNLRLSLHFTLLVGGPSAPIAAVLLAGHTPAASAAAAPLATQKATAPNAALVASNQPASYWALDRVSHRSCHDAFQSFSCCRRRHHLPLSQNYTQKMSP